MCHLRGVKAAREAGLHQKLIQGSSSKPGTVGMGFSLEPPHWFIRLVQTRGLPGTLEQTGERIEVRAFRALTSVTVRGPASA